MEPLTKQEAINFFAIFYKGAHHIPGYEPKPWGEGWTIIHDRGDLATFDFSQLTQLVVLAHDKCIRVGIEGHAKNKIRISIWKRQREGDNALRHPELEENIADQRKRLADFEQTLKD